jgi:hypothetical protein
VVPCLARANTPASSHPCTRPRKLADGLTTIQQDRHPQPTSSRTQAILPTCPSHHHDTVYFIHALVYSLSIAIYSSLFLAHDATSTSSRRSTIDHRRPPRRSYLPTTTHLSRSYDWFLFLCISLSPTRALAIFLSSLEWTPRHPVPSPACHRQTQHQDTLLDGSHLRRRPSLAGGGFHEQGSPFHIGAARAEDIPSLPQTLV